MKLNRTRVRTAVDGASLGQVAAFIAAACLLVQLLAASLIVRSLETPNASTVIARNLVATGQFSTAGDDPFAVGGRRAFQLPGEPLYLAAGFLALPTALQAYLHVPVTTLFVTCIAIVSFLVAGPRAALMTGLIGTLDPFVISHGRVWDDTFLGASLDWTIVATFAMILARSQAPGDADRRRQLWVLIVVGGLAAWAGMTRLHSQVVITAISLCGVAFPGLRPIRSMSAAALVGLMVAWLAWGLRNFIVLGVFLFGTTHDGQTLLQSNHLRASESIMKTGVTQTLADLGPAGRTGELEQDRQLRSRALEYIQGHPVDAARTAGLKIVVSLTGLDFTRPFGSTRNVTSVIRGILLFCTALWGWRWWAQRKTRSWPLASFLVVIAAVSAIVSLGMLAIGPVGMRYWISAAGLLYMGTGFTVARS